MAFLTPVAILAISVATSVASAGFAMYQGIQQAKYQSAVAKRNAQIEDNNAKQAIMVSQIEQQEQDFAAADVLGQLKAGQSASGIALRSESFLKSRKDAQELARKDAQNIRAEGAMRKTAFLNSADTFRAESRNAQKQIPGIIAGGVLNMGSSLIGGISSYSNYTSAFGSSGSFLSKGKNAGSWF